MNMKFKKAWNDLRINPGRTALVIFALVIGLWGVGSILVSYVVLNHDLKENFLRTMPPHAVLTSGDFNRLDLAAFRRRPEIAAAELRDLSLQRIEVHPNEWITLWIFGVEDFKHFTMARIYPQRGNTIPGPGTMLIERNGLLISNLDVGSRAHVRAGNRVLEVPITGICFDPAQAPATQDHFIYAYVDKKTYSQIVAEPANQRLLYRLKHARSKEDVQAATDRIIDDFRSQAIAVRTLNIPKLDAHPHQWQLNTLLFLEGSIGFLAFLMGAVLVSQLMAAILARQVRQIGVLKAIGASRHQVFQVYLAILLVFGATSGAIAIPLAVWSGYAFAEFVAFQLNFNILTTSLPHVVYLYLVAASLLLPILLSLPALRRGVDVSVRDAITDYGIQAGASGGTGGAVAALPVPPRLLFALRNTMRQKKRLAVTVVTMALGVAIFSTGFNVRESLIILLANVRNAMKHDVQVVLRNQVPREEALAPFASVGNVARVETWNGGRGQLQSQIIATTDGVGIVALPWNTDLLRLPVIEGRWLGGAGRPEVVMNQQAMEVYHNPKVGSSQVLTVGGKLLTVRLVGVVEELEKAKIYMDERLYDAAANPNHLINSMMFVASDKAYDKVIALKGRIEQAIESTDLNVLYVMSQAERTKIIYDHLNIILTTIVFLALLVLVVSALGMASATGINIMERTREIGVLRAIGATPGAIYHLFVAEGMVVSIASMVLGMLLSWPLSVAASRFFGNLMLGEESTLRFAFSVSGFWTTLITTVVFGWLASRIPARKAIQVSTMEALSYE